MKQFHNFTTERAALDYLYQRGYDWHGYGMGEDPPEVAGEIFKRRQAPALLAVLKPQLFGGFRVTFD